MSYQIYIALVVAITALIYCAARSARAPEYLILGFILPIDYVQFIPPLYLDLVRFLIAATLILRGAARGKVIDTGKLTAGVAIALVIINTGATLKGFIGGNNGVMFEGAVGLITVVVAYSLVTKSTLDQKRSLCLGLLASMLTSTVDIYSQIRGGFYMGAESEWGIRYSGFSFAATKAAPLFAMAILIALTGFAWAKFKKVKTGIIIRFVSVMVCFVGLYHTGGRGGMLAILSAAALIFVLRAPAFGLISIMVAGFVIFNIRTSREWLVETFTREGTDDLSSGRLERNIESLHHIADNPVFGPVPEIMEGLNPHAAILTFGLGFGALGLLLSSWITLACAKLAFEGADRSDVTFFVKGGGVIALVVAFLEPTGLFVGLSALIPLFVVFVLRDTFHESRQKKPVQASRPMVPTEG